MTDGWIDGFERLPILGTGGTWAADAPARGILHTTEGYASLETFVSLYNRTGNYPQFTVDPRGKRKSQHLPVTRSSTAAKNARGGVETNRLHAIQVEIVWKAAEIRNLRADQLAWLGREVIAPISTACGIGLHSPPFVGSEAGYIARPDAPQRMRFADWLAFNGWCGHQHIPENDHWDPGALDMEAILAAASSVSAAAPTPPAPPLEDDDMATTFSRPSAYNNIFIDPIGGTVSVEPETVEVFDHRGRLASLVWKTWGLTIEAAEAQGLLERRG